MNILRDCILSHGVGGNLMGFERVMSSSSYKQNINDCYNQRQAGGQVDEIRQYSISFQAKHDFQNVTVQCVTLAKN